MSVPTADDVRAVLARLDRATADDLETEYLDFKPWTDPKKDMRVAVEYAVCFANADGGAVVFGVGDGVRGRASAIHGARNYDLDVWRRGLFGGMRPNLSVDVEELEVPEGTGKLLLVRVPKGESPPYGTADGTYKRRVGKNCMPMDPAALMRARIASGALDWSAAPADDVAIEDLDPVEIARAREILRSKDASSELLRLDDRAFLHGLEAVRGGKVTHTGLLLFGRQDVLIDRCPQHRVHYAYQPTETAVARNDVWRLGLLQILTNVDGIFSGPINPEAELSIGLFKMRIPAFPVDVVREAVLNAVTHRDYSDPGEVLIRHTPGELVLTSPGGFAGGVRVDNILRHEPFARNRTLASAFLKLRLVEAAGIGRRRICVPTLSYGKRSPRWESDGDRVTLRIFNGSFDERLARLVARWREQGREVSLDGLLVLTHLKENRYIDEKVAVEMLQLDLAGVRAILDQMSNPATGFLERRGGTREASYHLAKGVASALLGKAAYTHVKGIPAARYAELVRQYVLDHGSITNRDCRELLGLGDSESATVEASRYLKRWSSPGGFLQRRGRRGSAVAYSMRDARTAG